MREEELKELVARPAEFIEPRGETRILYKTGEMVLEMRTGNAL